jgi:hypothetical protein
MKKIITAYFLAILNFQGIGQIQKGNFILGGNIYYRHYSNKHIDTVKSTNYKNKYKSGFFDFSFNAGYFITNNLAAGAFFGYNSNSDINEYSYNNNIFSKSSSETRNTSYSTGIFTRFYDMKKENKLRIFAQLNGSYRWSQSIIKNKQINAPEKREVIRKGAGYQASISPGIVYFVTDKIGLETTFGSISYSHGENTDFSNGIEVNRSIGDAFNTSFSLSSIHFGVHFYFGL